MRRAKRMPEQTTARLPSPAATASLQWPIDQGATTASSQVGSTLVKGQLQRLQFNS
jgi:hypothetical protein